MKTYTHENREYVETGEERLPREGEWYLNSFGSVSRCVIGPGGPRKILIPKEQKVSEGQDEYQIPVLITAAKDIPGDSLHLRGKVIMCKMSGGLPKGPRGAAHEWVWGSNHHILYPTQAQVEAERAKLAPKPDTLPAPVRAALQAADLGCRREGVEKLIEAIYLNPPSPKGS